MPKVGCCSARACVHALLTAWCAQRAGQQKACVCRESAAAGGARAAQGRPRGAAAAAGVLPPPVARQGAPDGPPRRSPAPRTPSKARRNVVRVPATAGAAACWSACAMPPAGERLARKAPVQLQFSRVLPGAWRQMAAPEDESLRRLHGARVQRVAQPPLARALLAACAARLRARAPRPPPRRRCAPRAPRLAPLAGACRPLTPLFCGFFR